jgi:hypothetical protein
MWRIRARNESVTWSSFLEIIVSIVRQWIHWIWKTLLYWILLSNELLAWFSDFLSIVNLLIRSSEMNTSSRVCIRSEKTSWRSSLLFTIVNAFCLFIDESTIDESSGVMCWARDHGTTHWTLNGTLISRSPVPTSFRKSYHFISLL